MAGIRSIGILTGVAIIVIINLFLIYTAYLWLVNIEARSQAEVKDAVNNWCDCLEIVDDNGSRILVMNIKCPLLYNVSAKINNELILLRNTLLSDEIFEFHYENDSDNFTFYYNDCHELVFNYE
ncbi:hypothetical protein COX58_02060 [archaeon CG_4_10_14_0_2_um_filter_Archaea_38_6]|nr:MAG: hypothetical protein COS64_01460 [archaeon CG06_land_8_20_14_3_00_37_11]PJA22497.1 MAG: hypothetical protein COX58_02060 [archaeon CG_4_10_14_0_2_um_filter_Archaea_38_6]